jgi:predicted ATP-grasp superfamily ATP-dependent carboligase
MEVLCAGSAGVPMPAARSIAVGSEEEEGTMSGAVELWETPAAGRPLIAGWHQWADAGDVSSGLPQYLINRTRARRVGRIGAGKFYLFQIPGTHHFLRPVVRLKDGHPHELEARQNDFFLAGDGDTGFLLFLGEEPHHNEAQYADAFLDAAQSLGVSRIVITAGVHGPMPYDKDRQISCVYSLAHMKDELTRYAVRLSNYEGGTTIGTYLADRAEERDIEMVVLFAMVPSYDFSPESSVVTQRMAMDEDFKAWYDIMRRLNHMLQLHFDLSNLERKSQGLISAWDEKVEELERDMPELEVRAYLEQVNAEFTEVPFVPLSDVWEEQLGDLFEDS